MLSPRVLTSAKQASVYFEHDDYYVQGRQLAPSTWWGKGASRLRLQGEVDRRVFRELLTGRLPNGHEMRKGGIGIHRPGVDFTFSAPKSVSIAALVGGDERIFDAHDKAVTAALRYLEAKTPRVRIRSRGPARLETTDNVVVARFNHDSSRAADPQLHTHAVILNVTQRKDGAWRAVSNEELFRSWKVGGVIYRAELARSLRAFGYTIQRTHADGRFEIAGIDKEQLAAFSKRRAQIREHLEARGLEGPRAADHAARKTRERKQDLRRSELQRLWAEEARRIHLDFTRVRGSVRRSNPGLERQAAEAALDHAIAHLTERNVVASEKRIIEVALGFGVGEVRLQDLERALTRRLEGDDLVLAVSSRQKDPFARHYTTDAALAVEQDLVRLMKDSRQTVRPILEEHDLEQAMERIRIQSPYPISRGQEDAIRLALSTSDRLVGIQGYAGTGKTTGALLHVRTVAEAMGFDVRGFAPSAVAAEILSRDAGIKSSTIAKLLKRTNTAPSNKPELWIVDEVSMMGNETAHALLRLARQRGARLIWVGDRDQLPAIEAGRAFGLLLDHGLSVARIETIVRQKDPELRRAVKLTIGREHERAIESLKNRVVEVSDREARLRAVAGAFLEIPDAERRTALVVTPAHADRRRISAHIRAALREEGAISGPEMNAQILTNKNLTRAQRADAAHYEKGDIVRFGRTYNSLGVKKDQYLLIKDVDVASGRVVLVNPDGVFTVWDPKRAKKVEVYRPEKRCLAAGDKIRWTRNDNSLGRYNAELADVVDVDLGLARAQISVGGHIQTLHLDREQHWDHAYVSTVHAAQGRTADRVILHIDTGQGHLLGHESWYVGISRAKRQLQLFTDSSERLPLSITTPLEQDSAVEIVREAAARTLARAHAPRGLEIER